jgi:hypothetical protein
MNIRKYMVLMVSGTVTAVLAGVLGFFLYRSASDYSSVNAELEANTRELNQLGNRMPFPNEENVAQAAKNLERIEAYFGSTMEFFLKGQYTPPAIEPARFPQFLSRAILSMNQLASSNNVAVPQPFYYGFDRYSKGQPPATGAPPRLCRQVHVTETLVRALCAARIRDIVSIERHAFEDETPPVAGAEGQPEAGVTGVAAGYYRDPAGLFEKERLSLVFNAKESSVWEILNALPKLPTFCVASDLDMWNEMARPVMINPADGSRRAGAPEAGDPGGLRPPGLPAGLPPGFPAGLPAGIPSATPDSAGSAAVPTRPLKHEERIVAGRTEVLKVRLDVDFYTFHKPGADAAGQEKQP